MRSSFDLGNAGRICLKVLHLVFLLIIPGTVQGYNYRERPGQCPQYAPVPPNDRSCQLKPDCETDYDCAEKKKCCENSCGVTKCIDPLPVNVPVQTYEKCPIYGSPSGTCTGQRTKFCYKDDCKRCCFHVSSCNPTPALLTTADACYKDLCKKHVCSQQGTQCIVDQKANEPKCVCIEKCSKETKYVCGTDGFTYKNLCYLNEEACKRKSEIKVKQVGICPAIDSSRSGGSSKLPPPIVRPSVMIEVKSGETAWFICEGPKDGSKLKWFKRRSNGDIPMPESVTFMNDIGYRQVLFLRLSKAGHGNAGIYVCKRTLKGFVSEKSTKLLIKTQVDANIVCLQLSNSGPCDGDFKNFYYDVNKGKCVEFRYGGCHGNGNNFEIKGNCEVMCKGIKLTASPCAQNASGICTSNVNEECSKDTDCEGDKKCCYAGCSKKCVHKTTSTGKSIRFSGITGLNSYEFMSKVQKIPFIEHFADRMIDRQYAFMFAIKKDKSNIAIIACFGKEAFSGNDSCRELLAVADDVERHTYVQARNYVLSPVQYEEVCNIKFWYLSCPSFFSEVKSSA